MKMNDVLYTPLDTAPQPLIDIEHFEKWLKDSYNKLGAYRQLVTDSRLTAINKVENYPWNLVLVYYNMLDRGPGWLGNFDKEFPELANWFTTAFGVTLKQLGTIAFLPVKHDHVGWGFWHNDPDPYGLRFYVDFESSKNKLFVKRTSVPYDTRHHFEIPIDPNSSLFQKELIECKSIASNQSFYLNNIRSIHATYTGEENKRRIACLMSSKYNNHKEYENCIEDLVVRSAQKFSDYAVLWKDENGGQVED